MKKEKHPSKRNYPEQFKRKVIEEYLRGGRSKMSLLKKYDIRMKSGIQRWIRQLGYEDIHQKVRYLDSPNISTLATKKSSNPIPEPSRLLEDRIKELERRLEDEQLRSEAYQRVIDIAENEFNIPIRKKPSTK